MIDQYGDFYMVSISTPSLRKQFALVAGFVTIGSLAYNGWLFFWIFVGHWGLVGAYIIRLVSDQRGKEFQQLSKQLDEKGFNYSVNQKILGKMRGTAYPSLLSKESREAVEKIYKTALIRFFKSPLDVASCDFYLNVESFYFHLKPNFWREVAAIFSLGKNTYNNPPKLNISKYRRKSIKEIQKQLHPLRSAAYFKEFTKRLKRQNADENYERTVYEVAQDVLIDYKREHQCYIFFSSILEWYRQFPGNNDVGIEINIEEYKSKLYEIEEIERYIDLLERRQNLTDIMEFVEGLEQQNSRFLGDIFEEEYKICKRELVDLYINTLFEFLEKGKVHKRILSSLSMMLSKTYYWNSQEIYDRTLNIYQLSKNQDSLKVFVLQIGRLHFSRKNFSGTLKSLDEEMIRNDILMRTRN